MRDVRYILMLIWRVKLLLLVSILAFFSKNRNLHAQHLLSHLEIQGGGGLVGYDYIINDRDHNLYAGFQRPTWLPAVVDDVEIYGSRLDTPDASFRLRDLFFVKFDSDHNIQNSFVIDNADLVLDFHTDGAHSVISLSLSPEERMDSMHPIILGGGGGNRKTGKQRQGSAGGAG